MRVGFVAGGNLCLAAELLEMAAAAARCSGKVWIGLTLQSSHVWGTGIVFVLAGVREALAQRSQNVSRSPAKRGI